MLYLFLTFFLLRVSLLCQNSFIWPCSVCLNLAQNKIYTLKSCWHLSSKKSSCEGLPLFGFNACSKHIEIDFLLAQVEGYARWQGFPAPPPPPPPHPAHQLHWFLVFFQISSSAFVCERKGNRNSIRKSDDNRSHPNTGTNCSSATLIS